MRVGRVALRDGWIDLSRGEVHRETVSRLTRNEAALLAYLAARPGETCATERLLRDVWGYSDRVKSRTVGATVLRLRHKLARGGAGS